MAQKETKRTAWLFCYKVTLGKMGNNHEEAPCAFRGAILLHNSYQYQRALAGHLTQKRQAL